MKCTPKVGHKNGEQFMKRHPFEERLKLAKKVKSGYPMKRLAKETGVAYLSLRDWVKVYERYGPEGLLNMSNHNIVPNSEKERMCRLYLEKGVPLLQIYISNNVSRDALKSWIRKVREGGYCALYGISEDPANPHDMAKSDIDILLEKLSKAERENRSLRAENERLRKESRREVALDRELLYLRAENALLKKAKALMEEEESRLKSFGQKPSKH